MLAKTSTELNSEVVVQTTTAILECAELADG